MIKNIKNIVLIIIAGLIYLWVITKYHIAIPCLFHKLTGLYCPGCGLTRMILALLKLDFYQAFRYNPLLFIMVPFFIILIIDYIFALIYNRKTLYSKISKNVWYSLLVILIIYGIIRNIFPPLMPTEI